MDQNQWPRVPYFLKEGPCPEGDRARILATRNADRDGGIAAKSSRNTVVERYRKRTQRMRIGVETNLDSPWSPPQGISF